MLLKNVTIFQDEIEEMDVRVESSKIVSIANRLNPLKREEVIDAKGKFLLPSIIDLNLSLKNNTFNKKNLQELCTACQKGGVDRFVLNSDYSPTLTDETFLELFNTLLFDSTKPTLFVSIPAINRDNRLNNISTLINGGAKVIELNSDIDSNLIKRVMEYSKLKNSPIFCYAQNESLDENGMMNDGEIAFKLGLEGVSKIGEISEIAKITQLATHFGVKIVFKTLSTFKSLKIIDRAKKLNNQIYAEVSIQNLVLNENECDTFNTYAKLKPPLREERERVKLLKALKSGKIDLITSAHSPKSIGEKDLPFIDAKFGTSSIEYFLSVAYTYLVKENIISMKKLIKLISSNPATILSIDKPTIEVGSSDFILFDPEEKLTIDDKNSIYHGKNLFGKIISV